MSEPIETERERVIALAHENHEFVQTECGLWYYWPDTGKGAHSAEVLRLIADELDRLNAIEIENERKFFNDLESAEGATT